LHIIGPLKERARSSFNLLPGGVCDVNTCREKKKKISRGGPNRISPSKQKHRRPCSGQALGRKNSPKKSRSLRNDSRGGGKNCFKPLKRKDEKKGQGRNRRLPDGGKEPGEKCQLIDCCLNINIGSRRGSGGEALNWFGRSGGERTGTFLCGKPIRQ